MTKTVSGTTTIEAQYGYDPYGIATKLQGSQEADFQYAGYYMHAPSGLNLPVFRAYSSSLGRFINRDPIGEAGGINLYAYVGGRVVFRTDLLGLEPSFKVGLTSVPVVGDVARHTGILIFDPYNTGDNDEVVLLSGAEERKRPLGRLVQKSKTDCDKELEDQLRRRDFRNFSPPPGVDPALYSLQLIHTAHSYDNSRPYFIVPEILPGTYNSNSFTAGVIEATGGVPPALGPVWAPGYYTPVPAESFSPHP